jgi:predicted MPP superfamily phosphohydrolase
LYARDLGWYRLLIILPVLSLVLLSQYYWIVRVWRLARRIQRPALRNIFRGTVILVFLFVFLIFVVNLSLRTHWRVSAVTALSGLWISSALFAYFAVQLVAAIDWFLRAPRLLAARLWPRPNDDTAQSAPAVSAPPPFDLGRRRFVQTVSAVAGSIPFAVGAYGFAFERLHYQIHRVDLPVSGLPPTLEGLRIAQLSDIHIGSYMSAPEVRRAVGMANDLNPDLTVVTGDFLTAPGDPLEACIDELSRLSAPLGVWGCNGNHEAYADAEALAAELFVQHRMGLLRQENVELVHHGQPFNLIGVDYQRERPPWSRRPMLGPIAHLVRRDVPNILLSHNPNSFPRAAELGIEVQLAGHTHGGQVRVEILDHRFSPAEFFTPYIAGFYQRPLGVRAALDDRAAWSGVPKSQPSALYVNRGLGTIGAPIRLGVPPEITLLTLRRA